MRMDVCHRPMATLTVISGFSEVKKMANWTNIPTDRIEPGKPIRAIDGLALRDNPIAIAQGAPGAPKVEVFEQLFTESGTFVAPKTGRYFVDVVGGGGNGGSGSSSGGGGGGGAGQLISVAVTLTAGNSYPVVVAGAGGTSSVAGVSAVGGGNGGGGGGLGGIGGGGNGSSSDGNGGNGGNGHFGEVLAANGDKDGIIENGGRGGRGYGGGGGGGASGNGIIAGGGGAQGVVRIRW